MSAGAPPIYTKTGDDGTTGLLFGGRVSKADRSWRRAERSTRPPPPSGWRAPASAALDMARTFLRRAERRLVAGREGGITVSATLIAYVNRASDLAYVLARRAAGDRDEPLSHQ